MINLPLMAGFSLDIEPLPSSKTLLHVCYPLINFAHLYTCLAET